MIVTTQTTKKLAQRTRKSTQLNKKFKVNETADSPPLLQDPLLPHLLELPFDAYLRLVALLLERLGYKEVEQAGRTDWKGRNRFGGFDLLATRPDLFTVLPGGIAPRRSVVQVKQFDKKTRVFQRHVDELRGAAIRAGASEAILLTTGLVSSVIDTKALASPILPVRLIGGGELLTLLREHHVGVTETGEVDHALLERLTSEARGNGRGDCQTSATMEADNGKPDLTLTVEILAYSKKS